MACSNNVITILLLLLPYIATTSAVTEPTSTFFILTSCSKTTYPIVCFTSLATRASAIQTSPELLANTALSVTLNDTKSTSTVITILSQVGITYITNPILAIALRNCAKRLTDSVDELNKSIGLMSQLKGPDFDLALSNIRTFLSTAVTIEGVCTDGLSKVTDDTMVVNLVKASVVGVAHMTTNAMDLVNQFAANVTR